MQTQTLRRNKTWLYLIVRARRVLLSRIDQTSRRLHDVRGAGYQILWEGVFLSSFKRFIQQYQLGNLQTSRQTDVSPQSRGK